LAVAKSDFGTIPAEQASVTFPKVVWEKMASPLLVGTGVGSLVKL